MIQFHALVSVALALVVVGIVYYESDKTTNTTKALLKVGAALALLAYVLLVFWVHMSWRSRYTDRNAVAFREGTWVSFSEREREEGGKDFLGVGRLLTWSSYSCCGLVLGCWASRA